MNSFTNFFNFAYFSGIIIKEHYRMAASVSRGLMLFSVTKNRWKMKKESYLSQNCQDFEECLWFKNYQQSNVFTSNGSNNEKLSLKTAVPKMIFSIYLYKKLNLYISSVYNSLIFTKTYLFSKILKKLLTKLSFSDEAGLKPITAFKKWVHLHWIAFCCHFRNTFVKELL